jgi:hypothetical protein
MRLVRVGIVLLKSFSICDFVHNLSSNSMCIRHDLSFFHLPDQMIPHLQCCSTALETSGAALLQRQPLSVFGKNLISAGQEMASLASLLQLLPDNDSAVRIGNEAAQRCQYAATQMTLAGTNLCPSELTINTPASGKSWLKGGI